MKKFYNLGARQMLMHEKPCLIPILQIIPCLMTIKVPVLEVKTFYITPMTRVNK